MIPKRRSEPCEWPEDFAHHARAHSVAPACHVQVYRSQYHWHVTYPWTTSVEYGEQSNFWVYETHLEALAKAIELAELNRRTA